MQHMVQLQGPIPVSQQITLPHRTPTVVIHPNQMTSNQIFIAQQSYKSNGRGIQPNFAEKILREVLPQSSPGILTVQTIQRDDSPNINVISANSSGSEPMIVRVSNSTATTPAVTPTGQEWNSNSTKKSCSNRNRNDPKTIKKFYELIKPKSNQIATSQWISKKHKGLKCKCRVKWWMHVDEAGKCSFTLSSTFSSLSTFDRLQEKPCNLSRFFL